MAEFYFYIREHRNIYKVERTPINMTHAEQRKFKIDWLINMIKLACDRGVSVSKDKLLGEFCIEFGAGRRYALDYLKDLESAGRIRINGDDIFTPELLREKDLKEKEKITKETAEKEATNLMSDILQADILNK